MLRHLVSLGIKHKSGRYDILECHGVENHRGNSVKRKEPATGLVNTLVDEVSGEGLTPVYQVTVLERIVNLGIGHRAGVKPHVNKVRLTLHGLARRGDKYDIVDIWTVKVYSVVVLLRHVTYHEALLLERVRRHHTGLDGLLDFCIQFLYAGCQLIVLFSSNIRSFLAVLLMNQESNG